MEKNSRSSHPMLHWLALSVLWGFISLSMLFGCKSEPPGMSQSAYIINNSDETVFVIQHYYTGTPHENFSVATFFDWKSEYMNVWPGALLPGDTLVTNMHTAGFNGLNDTEDEALIYALKLSTLDRWSKQEIIDRDICDARLHVTLQQAMENAVFFLF